MSAKRRFEAEWEGLRLVIDECPDHWQVFVYDPAQCEVLYTAERISLEAAKLVAVEFAAPIRFGPSHVLKPEVLTKMLAWKSG